MPGFMIWGAWVIWAMLIAGGLLSTIGLWRSSLRWLHWKRLRTMSEGELVPADPQLMAGRQATVATLPAVNMQINGCFDAQIVQSTPRTIKLCLPEIGMEPILQRERGEAPAGLRLGATLRVSVPGETAL